MATLNANTWKQAQTYVSNFLRTGDIGGNGSQQIPVPNSTDMFVPTAEVLFQQVIQKHGGDPNAYHGHTGTAGALIALIDQVRVSGNPAMARQVAESIHNKGSGRGFVMTSQGSVEFKGTSGCTRSDLQKYLSGSGVFQGIQAGRQ